MFREDDPNLVTCLWVGTGRYAADHVHGTMRNFLTITNMLGITPGETVEAYKARTKREYEWYLQTPCGRSIAGSIGESGIVFYMIAAPFIAAPTDWLGSALLGMSLGFAESVTSASINPTVENMFIYATAGYLFGQVNYFITRFNITGYNTVSFMGEVGIADKLDRINTQAATQEQRRVEIDLMLNNVDRIAAAQRERGIPPEAQHLIDLVIQGRAPNARRPITDLQRIARVRVAARAEALEQARNQHDIAIEYRANELWEQSIGGTGWWNNVDGRFDGGARTSWGTPITWTRDQIRDDLRNGNPFNPNNCGINNSNNSSDNRYGDGPGYSGGGGSSSYATSHDYSSNFSSMDSAPSFSWAPDNRG